METEAKALKAAWKDARAIWRVAVMQAWEAWALGADEDTQVKLSAKMVEASDALKAAGIAFEDAYSRARKPGKKRGSRGD